MKITESYCLPLCKYYIYLFIYSLLFYFLYITADILDK